MAANDAYGEINESKASMDHIYDQPDPRAYFRELQKLDYAIPGNAQPVFRDIISRLRETRDGPVRVLDIGCSYGVNAALLKHGLSLDELYDHWVDDGIAAATPDELIAQDRHFFKQMNGADNLEVIGLDTAEHAVEFAEKVGLLDEGLAVNLEEESLPAPAREELAPVDLVVSTGCVGYVSETTFERLLPAVTRGRSAWLANFVLRMFPFDPIEKALARWGYVTEKLVGQTFIQREFASAEEQAHVLEQLSARGIDAAGAEAEGHLVAEFYLSRPAGEAAALPLAKLLAA